jgi:hypothetical protein
VRPWVRFLAAAAQVGSPQRELLRADPATSVESSRLTSCGLAFAQARLSPDPELADQRAIALDVGVPQVVQQTPLLANQEEKAAARVMVLGVHFQVLGELPDARGGERDLDLGRARVLVAAPVLRDQLAFDFCLCCQTECGLYRAQLRARFRGIRRQSRPNEDQRLPAMRRDRRRGSRAHGPASDVLPASARREGLRA